MQFIKAHLISLLCGVGAIAALAVGILGMMATSVVDEMNKRVSDTGAREIRSLAADPQNERKIEAERAKGEKFEEEYQRTLAAAYGINQRGPLMAGVFPKPDKESTKFQFVEVYERALRRLPIGLIAGTLPTNEEVEDERQNVLDLQLLEAEQLEEGGQRAPAITQRNAALPRARPPPAVVGGGATMMGAGGRGSLRMAGGAGVRGGGGRFAGAMGAGAPARAARGGEPKYDPVYRANVSKAKSIRCYVDPPTFHVSPIVNVTSAPPPDQMWFAQVSLWVQQDLVAAIARVNEAAARQVTDGDAYVEQMPVKRIELLRVLGYQAPGGLLSFPGGDTGGVRSESFTGQTCNDQFDVVRFVLVVVVDQRDVLQLIDQISKQNYYQCIGAGYSMVNPDDAQHGYLYGPEPVVRVQLEFEGYMARAVYKPLMPAEIRRMLGADEGDDG